MKDAYGEDYEDKMRNGCCWISVITEGCVYFRSVLTTGSFVANNCSCHMKQPLRYAGDEAVMMRHCSFMFSFYSHTKTTTIKRLIHLRESTQVSIFHLIS